MGGASSSDDAGTQDAIKKLRQYQATDARGAQGSEMLQAAYTTQTVGSHASSNTGRNVPWDIRAQNPWEVKSQAAADQESGMLNHKTVQMTSLSNDFILDKTSVKLLLAPGQNEIFNFSFNFTLIAPNCTVSLHQQVFEMITEEPATKTALSIELQPASWVDIKFP